MIIPFSSFLEAKEFLGLYFRSDSWTSWKGVAKAIDNVSLSEAERELFSQLSSNRNPETVKGIRQLFVNKGRGSGGSRMLAARALHSTIGNDWTPYLAPGETATALILATDKRQASETFSYVGGLVDAIPVFTRMVTRRTSEVIEFTNKTRIEVRVNNFRRVRGYTLCFAGLDELAFWLDPDTGANPAKNVYNALLPGLGRLPGSFLMGVSTPWSNNSFFAEQISKFYGKESNEALALSGETLLWNPSFDKSVIDSAYASDEIEAQREYGAIPRPDIAAFVPIEVVQAAIMRGRFELPYITGIFYFAFVDPSGGSSDSMTLGIAHRDDEGKAILDLVRESRPPFSPESVVNEFAAVLRSYRIAEVTGDRYAGLWPQERFNKEGITYKVSEFTKSQIYMEFLPLLNSSRIELLDNQRLVAQLNSLERRAGSNGREAVDHAPNAKDDLINSGAGALVLAGKNAVWEISEADKRRMQKGPKRIFAPERGGRMISAKNLKGWTN